MNKYNLRIFVVFLSNLDWHWDLIDMLEKDNQLIQQVRARQKEFGPRGKERGK